MQEPDGGHIVAERLHQRGVRHIFTLCGGHISPILVGAENKGMQVVDVRDEVTAAFAADALARLTGVPGVAAVTAGPGVTNTITAVKNAQMAQSPLLILGGATPTILMGRGSLQDIDQITLMKPLVKWATSVRTLNSLGPTIDKALDIATSGTPGPVFVECPVDVLYPEHMVRDMYTKEAGLENATGFGAKALGLYMKAHLARQFNAPHVSIDLPKPSVENVASLRHDSQLDKTKRLLQNAEKPVLIVGSQAVVNYSEDSAVALAHAIEALNVPTFLGGMARGLLGRFSDIQFRHKRSSALKKADLVLIAGFPFDFRLKYGRGFHPKADIVSINLSASDLTNNKLPDVPVLGHPGDFIRDLAARNATSGPISDWFADCKAREDARDEDIAQRGETDQELVNPVAFFQKMEEALDDDSVLIVDGGDFVATGAYILRPRGPLRWLDPGVFGTLGVGGGFALGAALARPSAEVWLIYGDGSSAYSLAEFDTCVRHGLAPIAVIGTDASWAQIAREQVEMLGSDCATTLLRTEYHKVAEGYGGKGILVTSLDEVDDALAEAKKLSAEGKPVCLNIHLADSDFRKGSISM
jgi:acetolactate synthase-1/2/3 large subunit